MNDPQFYRATLAIFGSNQNEVLSTNSADGNGYLGALDFLILHKLEEDYIPKIDDPDEKVNEYVYSKSYIGQEIEICVFTGAHRDFLGLLQHIDEFEWIEPPTYREIENQLLGGPEDEMYISVNLEARAENKPRLESFVNEFDAIINYIEENQIIRLNFPNRVSQ